MLDVGCGAGESTRAAAAVAARVVGVDVSAPVIEHARRISAAAGLSNATFVVADAADHPFETAGFTACISRFGAMFFTEPRQAFAALGRALQPAGRLVLLVWQQRERNEWETAVRHALAPGAPPPDARPGSDAFSLADPTEVGEVLGGAGFDDVRFTPVIEPVFYGPDVETAFELVLSLREPTALIEALPRADRDAARERLRELLARHWSSEDGVQFGSSAWLVTATRTPG